MNSENNYFRDFLSRAQFMEVIESLIYKSETIDWPGMSSFFPYFGLGNNLI